MEEKMKLVELLKNGNVRKGDISDIKMKPCFSFSEAERIFIMTDEDVNAFYGRQYSEGEDFDAESWLVWNTQEVIYDTPIDFNSNRKYYRLLDNNDIELITSINLHLFYKNHYIYLSEKTNVEENQYYEIYADYEKYNKALFSDEEYNNGNYAIGIAFIDQSRNSVIVEQLNDNTYRIECKETITNEYCFYSGDNLRFFELNSAQQRAYKRAYEKAEEEMEGSFSAKDWLEANAKEMPVDVPLKEPECSKNEDDDNYDISYYMLYEDTNKIEDTIMDESYFYKGKPLDANENNLPRCLLHLFVNNIKKVCFQTNEHASEKNIVAIEVVRNL